MDEQRKQIPQLDGATGLSSADLFIVSQNEGEGLDFTRKTTFTQLKSSILIDAPGSDGATGPMGASGPVGATGSTGIRGLTGLTGPTGATGADGQIGGTGSTGERGYRGLQGDSGATGLTGEQGATGEAGATGQAGAQGATGLGSTGATGVAGQAGDRYQTTSSTELTVGDGTGGKQTLTVEAGLSYTPNQSVTISLVSNVNAHMHGNVFSYDAGTGVLVVSIISHSGTGTIGSSWTVNLAGAVGSVGATGLTGATGPGGGLGDLEVIPNSGISIASNQISTIYNTLIDDIVNSTAVGGASAAAASVWKTKSLVEALDTILFPDQLPTYTIPTIVLTATQSGTREVGSTVNQVMTLTATENDAGPFTYLSISRGGSSIYSSNSLTPVSAPDIASQYGYTDPNNPNNRYSISYTDNHVATIGTTTWAGTGNYGSGLAKKNNKNVTDVRTAAVRSTTAPQAAGTGFAAGGTSVTAIYPYFWGVSNTQPTAASISSAIAAGTTNKVLSSASGNVSVTFNASAQYVWVAIQADYTQKATWYNTALNNGNIGPGNFILSPTTYSVNSPESYWSGINYKIYISSGATNTEGAIIFQN